MKQVHALLLNALMLAFIVGVIVVVSLIDNSRDATALAAFSVAGPLVWRMLRRPRE